MTIEDLDGLDLPDDVPAGTPAMLRVRTAARALDVSDDTVYRLIQRGDLAAVRIGSGARAPLRVPLASVLAVLRPAARPATIEENLR